MKVNEILQQTKKVKSFLLFNEFYIANIILLKMVPLLTVYSFIFLIHKSIGKKLAYTLAFRVFPLPPKFFVRYFLKSFSVSFTI